MKREDNMETLQFENSQLRAELRAQQAVQNKLRNEKEETHAAIAEAIDEIRGLHKELDIRENMFQEFREAKEREIAELKKINQDLEMRLHVLEAQEDQREFLSFSPAMKGESMLEQRSLAGSLPQLSATEIVESLCRWEGMDDTAAVFDELIRSERGMQQWIPGSPWNSMWRFAIKMYISAPNDVHSIAAVFMKEHLPVIAKHCTEGGCYIIPFLCNTAVVGNLAVEEDYLIDVCSNEVEKSDVFICLLGSEANNLTKTEIEHGYLNNPSARAALFLFFQGNSESNGAMKLKQRIRKTGRNAKVIDCMANSEDGLLQLRKELEVTLNKEFMLIDAVQSNGADDTQLEQIGLLEDMRVEWEQVQLLRAHLSEGPSSLVGMDEVFERLECYLEEEGPVAPYLVTGQSGFGKTTLLAKWTENLSSTWHDRVLILYHYVKCPCSSTAESAVLMRRFIQKMMFYCGEISKPPLNPSKLNDCFMSWLNKLSTHLGPPGSEMAVIIIDNADLIMDCEQQLSWILQSLPNNVRVILTANEDNYPDSWRALPSPSIPTPTSTDVQEIIHQVQMNYKTNMTMEQVGMLAVCAPPIPLWCILATRHVLSITGKTSMELEEIIESLTDYEEVSELLKHILDELENSNPHLAGCMEQVLQLVHWSRNGLMMTELEKMTSIPAMIIMLAVSELRKRCIVSDVGGLIHIRHDQIQEAVQMKFCSDPTTDYMLLWTDTLVGFFSRMSELMPCHLMCRCAEELPWLLKRAELKEELYHTMLNIDILVQLFSSGRIAELFVYWQTLDPTANIMASQYHKALKKIEEEGEGEMSIMHVSSAFGTVGKVLGGLGFIEEALPCLQCSLELCESHFEPDGPEVGQAMCELAALYFQSGRFSAAEGFYKQALQIFSSVYGEESSDVLKVLEALSIVYKKLENDEIADSLLTKIYAIKQNNSHKTSASSILKSRALELEQFCDSHKDDLSLEYAAHLNELAVILTIYGDSDIAEELFMRSLKVHESVLGEGHPGMLTPLKNLGAFFMQGNKLDWATSLYEKALEVIPQFPDTHPALVDVTGSLALLYREQGRLDDAEPLQKKLIELKEKENGPDHLSVAKAVNNLAVIYCLKHAYDCALPLYDRALRIYEENLGLDHPTVLAAVKNRQLAMDLMQT